MMKSSTIVAFDIESYEDNIIAIAVYVSSDPHLSNYDSELFIAQELTEPEEKRILTSFIAFLEKNQNAILSSYNLLGFDLPLLYSRLRRYYPLGLQLSSMIQNFSLYDTMIAFKSYTKAKLFCGLKNAIEQLTRNGDTGFVLNTKLSYSGKDAFSLWLKEKRGVSKEFSMYIMEDAYNHMKLAQILLSHGVYDGLWCAMPSVVAKPKPSLDQERRLGDEVVENLRGSRSRTWQALFAEYVEKLKKKGMEYRERVKQWFLEHPAEDSVPFRDEHENDILDITDYNEYYNNREDSELE